MPWLPAVIRVAHQDTTNSYIGWTCLRTGQGARKNHAASKLRSFRFSRGQSFKTECAELASCVHANRVLQQAALAAHGAQTGWPQVDQPRSCEAGTRAKRSYAQAGATRSCGDQRRRGRVVGRTAACGSESPSDSTFSSSCRSSFTSPLPASP
jgi:hypothetical protein